MCSPRSAGISSEPNKARRVRRRSNSQTILEGSATGDTNGQLGTHHPSSDVVEPSGSNSCTRRSSPERRALGRMRSPERQAADGELRGVPAAIAARPAAARTRPAALGLAWACPDAVRVAVLACPAPLACSLPCAAAGGRRLHGGHVRSGGRVRCTADGQCWVRERILGGGQCLVARAVGVSHHGREGPHRGADPSSEERPRKEQGRKRTHRHRRHRIGGGGGTI